jgi:hypothetical protein
MSRTPSRITWALDLKTGKLVKADRAERKPGKGRYRCLDERCSRDLTVARSKQGRQHFRHFRNNHADGCVFQDLAKGRHQAAQRILVTLFSEALRRRTPMPLMAFNTPAGLLTVLPFVQASEVVMEWICPASGRRIDVAILDENGNPVLLVEVWHTHAVDIEKRKDLAPYWWIEVEANQVLTNTDVLLIRNHDNLPAPLALAWEQFELFGCSDGGECFELENNRHSLMWLPSSPK